MSALTPRERYERTEQALIDDFAEGLMTGDEFNAALRDLRTEAQQEAEDEAAELRELADTEDYNDLEALEDG